MDRASYVNLLISVDNDGIIVGLGPPLTEFSEPQFWSLLPETLSAVLQTVLYNYS